MTPTIQALRFDTLNTLASGFIATLQDKAGAVFAKIKEALPFQKSSEISPRPLVDFHPLASNPGAIAEGVLWTGFWGMSAWFLADSLTELYTTITVEHAGSVQFDKIGSVVKKAFVDLFSLLNSTGYMVKWADEAQVIALGQYLPFIQNFCYATSLAVSTIEAGEGIYTIWGETEAILSEVAPNEKEKHQKLLMHALIKLVGNVSMVAWAALGIATVAAGLVVSPILMSALLALGLIFGGTAILYKMYLTEQDKLAEAVSATSTAASA